MIPNKINKRLLKAIIIGLSITVVVILTFTMLIPSQTSSAQKCYGLHPRDELNCMIDPKNFKQVANIKCDNGTHAEEIDLSWNPVLNKENLETDCIPNSTNAQFWHDWYNSGCLWMNKHTEWATHISKMKQVNGTLFVCSKFDGFSTGDNQYGYQQVGMDGEQYIKSDCTDLATEVDGQCYQMITTGSLGLR